MSIFNKKSAFIAALIGVIFFWRKKKKSGAPPDTPGETGETGGPRKTENALRSADVAEPESPAPGRPN